MFIWYDNAFDIMYDLMYDIIYDLMYDIIHDSIIRIKKYKCFYITANCNPMRSVNSRGNVGNVPQNKKSISQQQIKRNTMCHYKDLNHHEALHPLKC
jgi:hypothetical protein